MAKEKKEKSKLRKTLEGIFTGIFVVLIAFSCFLLISNTVAKKKSSNPYAPTRIGSIYMPLLVLTDSMEPEIKTKSAIFIKDIEPEEVEEKFNKGETCDLTFDDTYMAGYSINYSYTTATVDFLASYTPEGSTMHKTDRTTQHDPASVRTLTHRLFYIQKNEDVELGNGRYLFFVEGINIQSTNFAGAAQYQVFSEKELYGIVTGTSVFIGMAFNLIQSPIGLIILLLIPSLYMIISSVLDLFKDDEDEEKKVTEGATTGSADALSKLSEKDIKRLKEEMLQELMGGKDKD